jgi:chaperonin cofactor prefoldin
MIQTPKGQKLKQKRCISNVSPELDEFKGEQKRLDTKNTPPPAMASLLENSALDTLDTVGSEKIPPWAVLFQQQFFDKLEQNTNEVKGLTTVTDDLKKSLTLLHGRADDLEKAKTKLTERATVTETKVEVLENKCADLTSKLSRLEEKVLRGEIRDKRNNLIFHGIKENSVVMVENCRETISDFIKVHLKIEDDMQVGRCHRLGAAGQGNNPQGN